MRSTRTEEPLGYLGVDPTSRYAAAPRPMDVCSLVPGAANQLRAFFWQWHWDPAGAALSVAGITDELRQARCTLVDGPQALAAAGRSARSSERLCRAPG